MRLRRIGYDPVWAGAMGLAEGNHVIPGGVCADGDTDCNRSNGHWPNSASWLWQCENVRNGTVAVPSPTQSKAAFPGHTCIVTDKLESETVAVTPTAEKYDSAAQNVCQQLFGAPKTYASGIPGGYELRCTGTGYGLIARIYTRPNANDDCQELATVGYRVVQPS
jgi:hypothetical protein